MYQSRKNNGSVWLSGQENKSTDGLVVEEFLLLWTVVQLECFPSLAINSTCILALICGMIRAASRAVLTCDMQAMMSQIIG